MNETHVMEKEDFKRCVDFHGHTCPGLAIGYRAAKAALEWLSENRATDEEMVATVETNACGTDALQVLTGCTLGKGNLLFKDRGKHVYTLVSRRSGDGVRIVLRPHALELSDRHRELVDKIREEKASPEERKEFWALHIQKAQEVLEKPLEALFSIKATHVPVPEKAMIEPSRPCDRCGEPTMLSRLEEINGQYLCRECATP